MKRDVIASLAWGTGIVVLALGASYARGAGWVGQDTVERIVLGATGLMIAAFGNRMPKALAPTATAQQVSRVGGWSLAISGLIYAGLWAFAPIDVAVVGGCAAIIIGMAITLGYCFHLRARANAGKTA